MRTVNFRVLGGLMLSLAVISGAYYAIHQYQMKRHAGFLLREADRARERKDWAEAIDLLDRYVSIVPRDNAGPVAELGLLQADEHRLGEAAHNLERALREDPTRDDVRRRLVEVSIESGRPLDAREHLEKLLKSSPKDGELYHLQARVLAALTEYSAAAASLVQAIENAPEHLEYCAQLADLLQVRLKDPAQALAVLEEMVTKNSDKALAYVYRGTYRLKYPNPTTSVDEGRTPKVDEPSSVSDVEEKPAEGAESESTAQEVSSLEAALADARRAVELASDDIDVIQFAVRAMLANGKTDEAVALARRGLTLHPDSVVVYLALADLEAKSSRRDRAISSLRRGLEAIPGDRDLLWNLANQLLEEGEVQEAKKVLEQLRSSGYPQLLLAYFDARLLAQQEQWLEASRQLEQLRPSLLAIPEIAAQADYQLGKCYEQLHKTDLQLVAFRRAAGVDPTWVPARLGIARALLSAGQIDKAIEEYRHIASLPGAPASVLEQLTRLLVISNVTLNPSRQDWQTASRLLAQLAEIDSESPAVPVLRADILVAQGDAEKAEELLIAARDRSPKTIDFWLALVALAERRDDADRAERLIEEARVAAGDSVPLRLAQARQLAIRRGADAKESLRELARTADSFSNDEQINFSAGLADLARAIGDFEEAERLYTLIADKQPTNLTVRLLLIELASRAGQTESMERLLDEVQRIEGSGPLWHYGQAVRLSLRAKEENDVKLYVEAEEHLAQARATRPGWSRIPLQLAHIKDAQKDEEAAIANYSQAFNLGERDPVALSRAVGLLYGRGRFLQADQLIRRLQEQQSSLSSGMTQLATAVSLRLNENERALELVTKLATTSKEPAEQIWAGRIRIALGKNSDAEQSFRRAIELDPTAPDGWVSLIQLLGRTGQIQKADETLLQAEKQISPQRAPRALAEAQETLGRLEESESRYKAALQSAPEDISLLRGLTESYLRQRRFQDATPLLARIMRAPESMSADDRLWYRRSMSLVLAARGDQASVKKALAHIEENLATDPKSINDQRAKALLLALLPDRESRQEAAKLLESLIENERPEMADAIAESRFALASIYRELGEQPKSAGQLRKLMATNGDNVRYVASYVQLLTSRKDYDEAEFWLKEVVKLAPLEITTLAMTTDLQFARERYDAIQSSVADYLGQFEGNEIVHAERARLASSLLETYVARLKRLDVEKPDAAAARQEWATRFFEVSTALIRNYVNVRTKEGLALAAFYGRQGRHDDSLDILDNNWRDAQPEEIATVTATLERSATATKGHFARAALVLNSALEKHGRTPVLVQALGNLYNWGGQFDDAERLYRETLAIDERNPAVLNNLAILLALRDNSGKEPLTLIQKAIEIVGSVPGLIDSRATIYLCLGDLQRAADDIAIALRQQPTADGYFRKAQIEQRQGNLDAARASMTKAGEIGLKIEDLHPLERPVYRKLQAQLR